MITSHTVTKTTDGLFITMKGEGDKSAAPAPKAAEGTSAPSGGLFQQGAAPQLATMQDESKGSAALADEQPKEAEDDADAAKPEDSKSAAVISETKNKLIPLGEDEEEDTSAAAAAPNMMSSIRVGDSQSIAAVPTSPAKGSSAVPVSAGVPDDDDDDDDEDLTGVSVPVNSEGDMARRLGSSLSVGVHSVAAQSTVEAGDVVKSLGDVPAEHKEDDSH